MYLFSATHASKLELVDDNAEAHPPRSDDPQSSAIPPAWRVRQRRRYTHPETDRSEWGYYLELAPPVVPITASGMPGDFADEGEHVEEDVPRGGHVTASRRRKRVSHAPSLFGFLRLSSSLPSFIFPTRRTTSSSSSTSLSRSNSTTGYTEKEDRMAVKAHVWISLWFLLTAPVILWDAGYCFMRPRSMVGGDLHWIWKPYEIYQEVDYIYGTKAVEDGDGFANAQSLLNVIETALNLAYVYKVHIVASPAAPLIGFAAATMTLSKTVLYWAQEYYCNGCSVGHNNPFDLLVFWIIPNGLWLIVPSLIVWQLSKDISSTLQFATKQSLGKTE